MKQDICDTCGKTVNNFVGNIKIDADGLSAYSEHLDGDNDRRDGWLNWSSNGLAFCCVSCLIKYLNKVIYISNPVRK